MLCMGFAHSQCLRQGLVVVHALHVRTLPVYIQHTVLPGTGMSARYAALHFFDAVQALISPLLSAALAELASLPPIYCLAQGAGLQKHRAEPACPHYSTRGRAHAWPGPCSFFCPLLAAYCALS